MHFTKENAELMSKSIHFSMTFAFIYLADISNLSNWNKQLIVRAFWAANDTGVLFKGVTVFTWDFFFCRLNVNMTWF